MGQRCQIAGRGNRALRGNDRRHTLGQHPLQLRDDLPAHTRGAAPQRQQFQHHHQTGDRARHRIAHTAAMRQDQVALQGGGVFRLDRHRCKFAKAGIDPVNRFGSGGGGGDPGGCRLDAVAGGRVQPGGRPGPIQPFKLGQWGDRRGKDFRCQDGLRTCGQKAGWNRCDS